MSECLPVVVAAPSNARVQLQHKNILPQSLFHDLAKESLWEENSDQAIYLWPYDIPYGQTKKIRDEITERVGDLPALFGMDRSEAKDHQERMLSRILFGSIIVHVIFLDNRKTDTTPGVEERNETYAQFCTFSDIIQWSEDLKKVMEVRLLNNESNSKHILVIISSGQQVITTPDEIKALNACIGESHPGSVKPFQACYFMDMNLNPGKTKKIIHSKYVWDVQVSRLLLALLLSQEKGVQDEDGSGVDPTPLHEISGIKIWRAEDCVFSISQDNAQKILKDALELAAEKLASQTSDQKAKWSQLETDITPDRNGLTETLKPSWSGNNEGILSVWQSSTEDSRSFVKSVPSMFRTWMELPVESCQRDVQSPEHWEKSFEALRAQRLVWSQDHKPKDYTNSVSGFFGVLKNKPGILNEVIKNLYNKMLSTYQTQTFENTKRWTEIAATEKQRQDILKKAEDDSKEFKKAQDHYVGLGLAALIVMSVTVFLGWMIWQITRIFTDNILHALLLSGMVLLGSFCAYLVVMLLHNFTGNRAADALVKEYTQADQLMIKREEKVKDMFLDGVATRDILSLQCVRFSTLQLAKRVLSILETELQPQLSSLTDEQEQKQKQRNRSSNEKDLVSDPDHVRDAFLNMTRIKYGPYQPNKDKIELAQMIDLFFPDSDDPKRKDVSFPVVWERICSYDSKNAGYYPAKVLISQIRSFVVSFLQAVNAEILKSTPVENAVEGFSKYLEQKRNESEEKDFLSASLPEYNGNRIVYLFHNPMLGNDEGKRISAEDDLRRFQSKQLEHTKILALYYQEYSVEFALKELPGAKTEYGQLTFKNAEKRGA